MDIGQPPMQSSHEKVHSLAKAFVSVCVPGGGELFEMIIKSPLEQRRDIYLKSVFEKLVELEQKIEGFATKDLEENENFKSLLLCATTVALKNHQKEKLDALKNIVLHAALPNDLEDDIQLMFVHIIDGMTTWHIKILQFLQNPTMYRDRVISEKSEEYLEDTENTIYIYTLIFPELLGKEHIVKRIIDDLFTAGLTEYNLNIMTYTAYGLLNISHISMFGDVFIRFISDVSKA